MIDLTTILMNVLATYEKNTTNYVIASYIMENIASLKKLENLTTGYIAKQCNVSKASISRFCRDVGIEDFYTFKYLLRNFYPHHTMTKKYSFLDEQQDLYTNFVTELKRNLNDLNALFEKSVLDEITNDIYRYPRVVLMGHQQSFALAQILQNDLGTAFSKYTLVCGDPVSEAEYFQNGTADDLFIVFSATGRFFENSLIKAKLCKRRNLPKIYLITVNPEATYPFLHQSICLAQGYNYPATLMMNIFTGLISSNYYQLLKKLEVDSND